EPGFGGEPLVLVLAPPGQRDEPRVPSVAAPANRPRDLVAVDARQPDVEDDDIGIEPRARLDRLQAVMRDVRLVPGHPQELADAFGRIHVVVDDENAQRPVLRGLPAVRRLPRCLRAGCPDAHRPPHEELAPVTRTVAARLY